jgi:hypothetical protein
VPTYSVFFLDYKSLPWAISVCNNVVFKLCSASASRHLKARATSFRCGGRYAKTHTKVATKNLVSSPQTVKRPRTGSASSPSADSNGSLGAVGAQRGTSRITTDRYQGDTASAYKTWVQGIDPKSAGKTSYASYIGAKVAQLFSTGWGVGVVCCIKADPYRKSVTRTPANSFSIICTYGTKILYGLRPQKDERNSDLNIAAAYADRPQSQCWLPRLPYSLLLLSVAIN